MGGYHYWKGGDHDPRDQVGVDPTGPAPADAEPAHPVWGYPFPAAGPPGRLIGYRTADGHLWRPEDVEVVYEAVMPDGR